MSNLHSVYKNLTRYHNNLCELSKNWESKKQTKEKKNWKKKKHYAIKTNFEECFEV